MHIDLNTALRSARNLIADNSPIILTATAAAGVVGTAVLAAKGAFVAQPLLYQARYEIWLTSANTKEEDVVLDARTTLRAAWRAFLPAALAGAGTIAAVIGAHAIQSRRSAAFVAALSISERAFAEYREQTLEQLGPKEERKIRDAVAQDRASKTPGASEVIIATDKTLFLDSATQRYFTSDMESVRQAEIAINHQIIHSMYASYNDFCELIGLSPTSIGDELGWNTDKLLDVQFSAAIGENNRPCIVIDYEFSTKHGTAYYKHG
jgi:hypothetical protein